MFLETFFIKFYSHHQQCDKSFNVAILYCILYCMRYVLWRALSLCYVLWCCNGMLCYTMSGRVGSTLCFAIFCHVGRPTLCYINNPTHLFGIFEARMTNECTTLYKQYKQYTCIHIITLKSLLVLTTVLISLQESYSVVRFARTWGYKGLWRFLIVKPSWNGASFMVRTPTPCYPVTCTTENCWVPFQLISSRMPSLIWKCSGENTGPESSRVSRTPLHKCIAYRGPNYN